MKTIEDLYTPSLALVRQVKAAAARVGLSQYKLAQILGCKFCGDEDLTAVVEAIPTLHMP